MIKEKYIFCQICRVLWSKKRSDIGPGCSQERDAEDAVTLEGKILTAVNKFLTTSPLINKVKLLMVSYFPSIQLTSNFFSETSDSSEEIGIIESEKFRFKKPFTSIKET